MRDRHQIQDNEVETRTKEVRDVYGWGSHDVISSKTQETLILEVLLDIRDLLVEARQERIEHGEK